MAEENIGQNKTEAATPRRREEARQQGQVAFSADLTSSLVLLLGLVILALGGQAMASNLLTGMRQDILGSTLRELNAEQAQNLFVTLFARGLEILGLFFGLMVLAGVAVPAVQVGFHLTPDLLSFNLERLSPVRGWSKVFSLSGGMRGFQGVFKLVVIGTVATWVIRAHVAEISRLSEERVVLIAQHGWALVLRLALTIAGAWAVLGAADYLFQRWRLEHSLMMTRQELKEELKRDEGDPMIKARIRKLQREAAQKRMFQDIPTASVVVTNPTHLAVALRYDRQAMGAPKVVAKGAGHVAKRIVALAKVHGVPVLERKPVAQALFKAVQVGQEIPGALYYVVAEVMAYVYRMRGMTVANQGRNQHG